MKDINLNLSPGAKKRVYNFTRGIMIFTSILLLVAAFMLPSIVLESKHSNNLLGWSLILSLMLFILTFSFMCMLLATKFRYELTFSDPERIKNWDKLSSAYKKFWIFQEIFTVLTSVYMFMVGINSIFYFKNWIGLVVVISSISLLINTRSQYLGLKEKREAKILKKVFKKMALIGGIIIVILLIILLALNFGKYYF